LPGFRTIAPDLWGFGESEELDDEATIEDYVELLRALLSSLRIEHLVAVGHSMGGQIVARLADEAKAAIRGVVLVEAPVSDELRGIRSPLLLVFGDETPERTAIAEAQRSQNRLAEVVFIKNASHNVMLDQPSTFYLRLGKFCESCFGSEDR
jgi:pimeloyl-ACP methyl ester carboxylesterase